jgi:hypothetical protein
MGDWGVLWMVDGGASSRSTAKRAAGVVLGVERAGLDAYVICDYLTEAFLCSGGGRGWSPGPGPLGGLKRWPGSERPPRPVLGARDQHIQRLCAAVGCLFATRSRIFSRRSISKGQ